MAWWQTHLVFQRDTLIAESLNDAGLDAIQFSNDAMIASEGEPFTLVVVSGYALYGQVRGYYALGVAQMRVDHSKGVGYMSEESAAHKEPVSRLGAKQKQTVREWLRAFNSAAWENSTDVFKQSLE